MWYIFRLACTYMMTRISCFHDWKVGFFPSSWNIIALIYIIKYLVRATGRRHLKTKLLWWTLLLIMGTCRDYIGQNLSDKFEGNQKLELISFVTIWNIRIIFKILLILLCLHSIILNVRIRNQCTFRYRYDLNHSLPNS